MTDIQKPTTAEILGAYSRELEAEGFDPDTRLDLVRSAADVIVRRDQLVAKPVTVLRR